MTTTTQTDADLRVSSDENSFQTMV